MVELNLLHTRREQLSYENKMLRQYLLAALGVALAILIVSHGWIQVANQHEQELINHLNEVASTPVNKLDADVNSESDVSSADILQLLNNAAMTMMNGICYTKITRDGLQVNMTGNAWTMAGISNLLKQFAVTSTFSEWQLQNVKQQHKEDILQFNLTASEA